MELCISHMHDLCNVAVFNLRLTKPKTRSRVGIVIWYASHPWRLLPVHTWGFVVDARFFRPLAPKPGEKDMTTSECLALHRGGRWGGRYTGCDGRIVCTRSMYA